MPEYTEADFVAIAQRYVDVWNEPDADKRRALVEQLFTVDATYTDPLGKAVGLDQVDGFIAAAQQQVSGLEFTVAGTVDGHHDIARFTWNLGSKKDVEPTAIGFDVIHLRNGSVAQVLGFLDKQPG